jgi:flavodoxin
MRTLVIYYSYSGNTKAIAEKLAAKESADIAEIKDVKRPGKLKAYTAGCVKSMRGTAWPIQPLGMDLARYDRLILLAPVWANNPPPTFNAVLELLPKGKSVVIKMLSASGKSNCKARLEAAVKAKGSTLEGFEDIKA